MKTLLVKDLLTQRWTVVLAGVYSLFFFGLFAAVREPAGSLVYVASGLASGLIITFGSFKADRNGTMVMMLSLPSTKRDVVNEKFALLGLTCAYGLTFAGLFGVALRLLGLETTWITPLDPVRVIAGAGLLSGAIPVYLRFGHRAAKALLVVALALGVAAQIGLAIAFSIVPGSIGTMIDAVLAWYVRTPIVARNLYWLIAGVAVLAVSYLGSMIFYPRRDV